SLTWPPFLNDIKYFLPSLKISSSNHSDNAFTTDAPTPWSPPDVLYPPEPNLPPACSTVKITSGVDLPLLCLPVGNPRPLSIIVILSSLCILISILSPTPF